MLGLIYEIAFVDRLPAELASDSAVATDLADLSEGYVSNALAVHKKDLAATCWRQVNCQGGHITPHGPCQSDQRHERQVMLAALDPADIAAIQTGFVRQAFLRHAHISTPGADAFAEDIEIRITHLRRSDHR